MKRFTILCIALMSLTVVRANTITGTCGENLTWSYDTESHALVISGTGDMYDYDYDNSPWYTVAGSISSVTLPDGLTRIGDRAFYDCENVISITIPNKVTSIGESAFVDCGFASIVIPNSVVSIEQYAFGWCYELSSVVLPNAIAQLPYGLFVDCHSLKQITIPASINEIAANVFPYCENVYLESSVPATIASNSFKSDVVLHVPCSSVGAYQAAPIWQFLNIMGNLDYNFTLDADEGGSSRISKSVCEANTVVIEATADAGYHFKSWSDGNTDNPRAIVLTADKSVTAQFERSTTYYKVSLSGIRYVEGEGISSSVGPNFSGQVLEGSRLYFAATDNCGTFIGWSDGVEESSRSIRVTQDTTIIANFTGIETYQVSVTAGDHGHLSYEFVGSITTCNNSFYTEAIADDGFHFVEWSDGNENRYRWFTVNSDLTIYAIFAKGEEGGKLGETLYWSYEADKRQLSVSGNGEMTVHGYSYVGYFEEVDITDKTEKILVEEGATNLSRSIFKSLRKVQSVDLAASVERIEESAFEDCRSLSQVTFAAGSRLTAIGDWAFYNCHELASIAIPEGVTIIGKAAFYGCNYLQELSLPASVRQIEDNAFAMCSRLQKIQVAAAVPPVIAEKTFFEVNNETPVYVQLSSVLAYLADPYWGRMNIIGAETPVDNTTVGASVIRKQLINGQLLILRDGKTFTVQGQQLR